MKRSTSVLCISAVADPPLAMAFLDRVVDGAIIIKINGRSYRAHRAKKPKDSP